MRGVVDFLIRIPDCGVHYGNLFGIKTIERNVLFQDGSDYCIHLEIEDLAIRIKDRRNYRIKAYISTDIGVDARFFDQLGQQFIGRWLARLSDQEKVAQKV